MLEEIGRAGLEVQLVFNRGALMLLPHDISKGSGITRALAGMGISPHNAIGLGDAENDHSLLDACEIGVAVGNAVDALKAHADIVLDDEGGAAVASFLRGPFLHGLPGTTPGRWRARLGTYVDDAEPVDVPGSRVNLGIFGESGLGKSYLAGLVAEQLTGLGYTLCVLDLEGDHLGLATLPGVIGFGSDEAPPSPQQLGLLFREGMGTAVIDLSMQGLAAKRTYAVEAIEACRRSRMHTGAPHWVMIDEAQVPFAAHAGECVHPGTDTTGLCIVSYRPERMCGSVAALIDIELRCGPEHTATISRRGESPRQFIPAPRTTPHDRHWHKYTSGELPAHRQFVFRDYHRPTGAAAGNVDTFREEIARARPGVLVHHAAHQDFSAGLATCPTTHGSSRWSVASRRSSARRRAPPRWTRIGVPWLRRSRAAIPARTPPEFCRTIQQALDRRDRRRVTSMETGSAGTAGPVHSFSVCLSRKRFIC